MHVRDSLRDLVMYRSLMSCHDPKEVVECKPFRKYTNYYSQERKDQKTTENSETSLMRRRHKECMVPKGSSCGNFIGGSSLHLIQVSKRNLIKYDEKSKDLLIALGELQEASQSNPKRLQIPPPSADGSSSICTKELKKVIKEGLVSQNRFQDSGSDTTSTSSKMQKRSNLVAKLIGLEEAPFASVKKKHFDGDKIMNQESTVIEINLPNERKSNSIEEKFNIEQKALRETIENVHFKGVLKNNFANEAKLQVHHHNDPNSKQFDDSSHIVPSQYRSTTYQKSVKTQTRVPSEELSMNKLREEVVYSRTIRQRKSTSSINIGKEMEKDASKQLAKEKGLKFLKEVVVVKPDAKGIDPIEESPDKVKVYCQVSHMSHVNETSDKKYKVQTISRQLPPEQDISKTRTNDCKDLSIHIKEIDSVSMKNQSPVAKHETDKPIVVHIEQEEVKQSINVPSKDNYTEIRLPPAAQVDKRNMMRWEADANTNKAREARESTNCNESNSNLDKELTNFLLTSESFIGEAKNLFNSNEDYYSKEDDENNWMANLSLQESQIVHSFLQNFAGDPRIHIPSSMLVEQIYDANESLKNSGEKHFADNVFAIIEKDIKCNQVINGGIWEQGWWRGFFADETELVVNEVERLLVTALVEEVIINLL